MKSVVFVDRIHPNNPNIGRTITVCDCHYELITNVHWFFSSRSGIERVYYYHLKSNRSKAQTRMLATIFGEYQPQLFPNYKDGNSYNLQCSNIEIVNRRYTLRSQAAHKDNIAGVKGVYWHKGRHKYVARIGWKGKDYYLGIYELRGDAVAARKEAESRLFHT